MTLFLVVSERGGFLKLTLTRTAAKPKAAPTTTSGGLTSLATIDMQLQNFSSPEFVKMFQKEVPLF